MDFLLTVVRFVALLYAIFHVRRVKKNNDANHNTYHGTMACWGLIIAFGS